MFVKSVTIEMNFRPVCHGLWRGQKNIDMSVTVCGAGRGGWFTFSTYILQHSFPIVFHKIPEGDPCPNFLPKIFYLKSYQIIHHSMQFCALILNMIFLLNKNVSEPRKRKNIWKTPEKSWFLENLLYGPGEFMHVYASTVDGGHVDEHLVKVWAFLELR